jgi:two-component system response regulator MprA
MEDGQSPQPMKILVADDDQSWSRFLAEGLRSEGMSVKCVSNGREFLGTTAATDYDVILLDVVIAGQSGYAVLRKLRARGNRAAVLIVTAKGRERDELEGFESGADDYLVKPVRLPRLLARMHAVLRRMRPSPEKNADPHVIQTGQLELHPLKREVKKAGRLIPMTKTEFSLLECLIRRPRHVLSRSVLCQHLISGDIPATLNVIDVHVRNIPCQNRRGFGQKRHPHGPRGRLRARPMIRSSSNLHVGVVGL